MSTPKLAIAIALLGVTALAAPASAGDVTGRRSTGKSPIDYENAVPKALPQNPGAPAPQAETFDRRRPADLGPSGFEPGGEGDGKTTRSTRLPVGKAPEAIEEPPSPPEFGTGGTPYTTALQKDPRVDPYRRAGKLFFKDGGGSFICSGSLIKPGLVVTAAHCVSEYGERRFYTDFEFVPAYTGGAAPFGRWDWEYVTIPTVYFKGKDKCAVEGVVCENDVAVIVLRDKQGDYPGDNTGWFGYAFGGYSFNNSNQAHITQLGYPGAINGGQEMIRTDSQGAVVRSQAKNTVIGSQQTGGSSGGPWLVNFGPATSPSGGGASVGSDGKRNTVVGATSWGYISLDPKEQGASPFTADNIRDLVKDACDKHPAAC